MPLTLGTPPDALVWTAKGRPADRSIGRTDLVYKYAQITPPGSTSLEPRFNEHT